MRQLSRPNLPKVEDLALFDSNEQWTRHNQTLIKRTFEQLSCKSANPDKFEKESIPLPKLFEVAEAAINDIIVASQNDLLINYLSDSLTWEEEPLDMGSHARQALLTNKSLAYRDVN